MARERKTRTKNDQASPLHNAPLPSGRRGTDCAPLARVPWSARAAGAGSERGWGEGTAITRYWMSAQCGPALSHSKTLRHTSARGFARPLIRPSGTFSWRENGDLALIRSALPALPHLTALPAFLASATSRLACVLTRGHLHLHQSKSHIS
ncbi:hypothetical protein BRN90_11920 [Xanthomonas oryzae pv. oryzae]|nr:hypothetical protein EBA18_14910 [Xanthomonas oryzae pv. oryzae]RBJ66374.1 hypothetical protein BRN90_11920 [Xanthomonas oryzae pv. oryzae]